MPCVLNAADEVAVDSFINKKIKFLDIEKIIKLSLKSFNNIKHPSLEEIINIDKEVRDWTIKVIEGGTF